MIDDQTDIETTLRQIGEAERLVRHWQDHFAWQRGNGETPTAADEMGLTACEATVKQHRQRLAALLGI
jgi:hypothetical protein